MASKHGGPTLGEVVTLVRGTTYKGALLGEPGPVLLGLASIQRHGGFRSDSLKTYGGECKPKLILTPGDLYVSLKDVTQSAELLGSIARVPDFISSGRLTQDTVKLDFINNDYPRDLLYWTLRSPLYRSYCREHATGTTTLGLARGDFLAFPLPVPTEQAVSLVELLEAIEGKIQRLSEKNTTLEAIAKAFFKSWFVDFDPVRARAEGREPEGVTAANAALFPSEFEESELGVIPKGWRVGCLGELCQNIRKQAKPGTLDASTPYIGLEHMPRGSIALTSSGTADGLASGKFWYSEHDVLFGKLRPYFHKVGVASNTGVCSTDILVIRASNKAWFGYTTMQLSSDAIIAYATRLSNGAKMPRSSWSDIAGYKVVIPPEQVAAAFDDLVRAFVGRIHINIEASKSLASLRDTLLPRLISRKIRMTDTDNVIEGATE